MGKYSTTKVPEKRYNPKGHGSERPSGQTGSKSVNEDGSSGKYFSTSGGFTADKGSRKNPPNAKEEYKEKYKEQGNTSEEEIEVIDLAKEIRTGKAWIVTNNDSTDKPPKFKAESYSDSFDSDQSAKPTYRSHHNPGKAHSSQKPPKPKEKPQPRRYSDSFDSDPPAEPAYRSYHKDKAQSSHKPPKPKERPQSRCYSDSFDSDPPAKPAYRSYHKDKAQSSHKPPKPKERPQSRRYSDSFDSDPPAEPAYRSYHKDKAHSSQKPPKPKERPQPRRYSDSFDSDPPAKPAYRSYHKDKAHSSHKPSKPTAKPASRRPYIESPVDSYSESHQPVNPASRHHTDKARRSDHGSSALPRSFTEPMHHSRTATYTAPAVPTYVADYTEEPRQTSGMTSSYSQRGYDRIPPLSSFTSPVTGTSSSRTYPRFRTYYEYDSDRFYYSPPR